MGCNLSTLMDPVPARQMEKKKNNNNNGEDIMQGKGRSQAIMMRGRRGRSTISTAEILEPSDDIEFVECGSNYLDDSSIHRPAMNINIGKQTEKDTGNEQHQEGADNEKKQEEAKFAADDEELIKSPSFRIFFENELEKDDDLYYTRVEGKEGGCADFDESPADVTRSAQKVTGTTSRLNIFKTKTLYGSLRSCYQTQKPKSDTKPDLVTSERTYG